MAVFGIATLPLWRDYLTAMTNLRVGPDYSLGSLPLLLVPVVAYLATGAPRVMTRGSSSTEKGSTPDRPSAAVKVT